MLKGFKEFISQGNALELAVAVIIGAAFKPIVDAITNVIMAVISGVVGEPSFDNVFEFYVKAKDDKPAEPTEAELLVQIRDLLATGRPNASAGQPRPKA